MQPFCEQIVLLFQSMDEKIRRGRPDVPALVRIPADGKAQARIIRGVLLVQLRLRKRIAAAAGDVQ